jgi:hypothetical protein
MLNLGSKSTTQFFSKDLTAEMQLFLLSYIFIDSSQMFRTCEENSDHENYV